MNLLRFLILAEGSLTLRQDREANARQEDRPSSSVRLEQLHPAENANQGALPQISATQAVFRTPANAAPAVPHRAVNVKPALSPREGTAIQEASPEAIAWLAALLRENVRQEAPALKTGGFI
jgi:hypothetical protein